jgi:hypothetical protein
MSEINVTGSGITSELMAILGAESLQPGDAPSYEICKLLWTQHVLGGKLVEKPVALALGERRKINVPCALEERLVEAFNKEWDEIEATRHITDLAHVSRAYGIGALIYGFPDQATSAPLSDPFEVATRPGLYFNLLDPLNTAGSMVTNQDPNAPDFQKAWSKITAAGQAYDRSRTCVLFNGTPVYLDYQSSSFSFSGRSIFLRVLYPLKSFIQSMLVDDMVSLKAGLLVAKVDQGGGFLNRVVDAVTNFKRNILKEGQTGQVISIGPEDSIESLDLTNTDKAMTTARDNIISNVAAGSDVPAILLKDESFAKGLSSGEQDMFAVVQYINGERTRLEPAHRFFDRIVQYRAWTPALFEELRQEYPDELEGRSYKAWFYEMRDLFTAEWPSLIQEPESEKTERNAKKLKAMGDLFKTLAPALDPENGAKLRQWITDAINDMPELFTSAMLEFDAELFANYEPPTPVAPGGEEEVGGDAD